MSSCPCSFFYVVGVVVTVIAGLGVALILSQIYFSKKGKK